MNHVSIKNIKDVIKIEQTPLQDYLQNQQTTYSILKTAAEKYQDKAALIFLPMGDSLADLKKINQKTMYSYQELLQGVNKTAQLLSSLEVRRGEVISYLLPNIAENYFVLYAAQTIGIANPISPVLPKEQIIELLQKAGSKILITLGEHIHPELWQMVTDLRSECPHLEKIIAIGGEENTAKQIFDFYKLYSQAPIVLPFDSNLINPHDVCSYFHTSGTTGRPKLAMHNHFGNAYMAWIMGVLTDYAIDTVVLSGLPLFHVGAPMVSGLAAFQHGAIVVVMSPLGWMDPNIIPNFWQIVEKYKVTTTAALPAIYSALLEIPINNVNIKSLKQAISGMAVSSSVADAFKSKTGININTLWGQTEVTSIGAYNPPVDSSHKHFGSMGIRLPFEETKVIRVDQKNNYLRDCLPNEPGLFCVKGPHVLGYKEQSINEQAFLQDDWFNTGDWVSQDEEGYFQIHARFEDFIFHKDKIISLLEIEKLAWEHPMVAEVTAIGIAVPEEEEVPVLILVKKPNVTLSSKEFTDWLIDQGKLDSNFFQIKIIFMDRLPKNGMGKPLKYVLKEQLLRSVKTSEVILN